LPPAAPAEDTLPVIAASPTASIPTATWLLLAWAIIALVALLPVAASLSHLRSIRRRGTAWPEGAARLAQLVHPPTGRLPAVLLDKGIAAPITGGLIQAVIALPAGAVTWSDSHLANALLHELEHVRRHDWAVHLATRAVCALYWFHPLAWIAWRRLRLEAERACDDAVLAREDAVAYADQLLALAHGLKGRSAQPGLPMVSGSDLSSRIKAALDSTLPRGRAGKITVVSIVLAAAVAITTLATLRAVGPSEPHFPYDSRVGLVSLRSEGDCLSIFNPSIATGTKLALVRPGSTDPAGVMEATVGERQSGECPASLDRQDDLDPTYYRIAVSGSSKPPHGQVFAILDPPGSIVLRDGKIVADIEGDGLRESFGTCTSSRNVHYVVWTETPAQRLKRWRGNIHAGYYTEVSCIDDDVLIPTKSGLDLSSR
jgi:beta-lactamase regulating signal transducer with metallopeptidase domain